MRHKPSQVPPKQGSKDRGGQRTVGTTKFDLVRDFLDWFSGKWVPLSKRVKVAWVAVGIGAVLAAMFSVILSRHPASGTGANRVTNGESPSIAKDATISHENETQLSVSQPNETLRAIDAHIRSGQIAKANLIIQPLLKSKPKGAFRVRLLQRAAIIAHRRGRSDDAMSLSKDAADHAKEFGLSPDVQAEIALHIANIELSRGQISDAESRARLVIESKELTSIGPEVDDAKMLLARVLGIKGREADALRFAQEAIDGSVARKDDLASANAQAVMMQLLSSFGDSAGAYAISGAATERALATADAGTIAAVSLRTAQALCMGFDIPRCRERALSEAQKAIRDAARAGDWEMEALATMLFASAVLDGGDIPEHDRLVRKASQMLTDANPLGYWEILLHLSLVLTRRGSADRGLANAEIVIRQTKNGQLPQLYAEALRVRSFALRVRNGSGDMAAALAAIDDCVAHSRQHNLDHQRADALLDRSRSFRPPHVSMKDAKANCDEAIMLYKSLGEAQAEHLYLAIAQSALFEEARLTDGENDELEAVDENMLGDLRTGIDFAYRMRRTSLGGILNLRLSQLLYLSGDFKGAKSAVLRSQVTAEMHIDPTMRPLLELQLGRIGFELDRDIAGAVGHLKTFLQLMIDRKDASVAGHYIGRLGGKLVLLDFADRVAVVTVCRLASAAFEIDGDFKRAAFALGVLVGFLPTGDNSVRQAVLDAIGHAERGSDMEYANELRTALVANPAPQNPK